MTTVAGVAGVLIILGILWEAFETVVLPRRVTRRVRLTGLFYLSGWKLWRMTAHAIRHRGRREAFLSYFGPLSMLVLFAAWAVCLIVGFALLQAGFGSQLAGPQRRIGLSTDVYLSGTTFFTLGIGDVIPRSAAARAITVAESGVGFGFLAMVIAYLPVLYQAFSRREVRVSVLDAWAGSPPAAGELLRRLGTDDRETLLASFLEEWEIWSAELLETMVSYPVLGYFRSQHDNQSWLAALTAVLDACAVMMSGIDGPSIKRAPLTFAMARHAVVDLCQVFNTPPVRPNRDRLPETDQRRLWARLRDAGWTTREDQTSIARLRELRDMYEPYVNALASRLLAPLPTWLPVDGARDNWQRTAWRTIGTDHREPVARRR